MPTESNLVALDGQKYQIVAQTQTPAGRRQWKRTKRSSQTSDPGVQKTASWRLNGPHGLSREDVAGGLLAVDYTEDMDTLYESLLIPGPKRNPIDLVSIASASQFVEALVLRSVTFPFTSAASVAGIGTVPWTDPTNALVDSSSYAFASGVAATSRYLELTVGAGSRVPAGVTVTGVEATIRRYAKGAASFLYAAIAGAQTLNTPTASVATAVNLVTGGAPATFTARTTLIAGVFGSGTPTLTLTPTAGWTKLCDLYSFGGFVSAAYYHVAEIGDSTNVTPVTLSTDSGSAGADVSLIVEVSAYLADPDDPIDVVGSVGQSSSAVTVSAPSVTTTNDNEVIVGVFARRTTNVAFTAPGGMTERTDGNFSTLGLSGAAANGNGSLSLDDESIATAGTTGARTATSTGSPSDDLYGVLIALNPYANISDAAVNLIIGGSVVGDSRAAAGAWPITATPRNYGAPSDTWGLATITDSDINGANLGLAHAATLTLGEAHDEYAEMTVSYLNPEIIPVYEARVGAFPVGGAPVGGGTATSVPQTVTNIDEDRGAIFFHGGAFSFQVEPSTMDTVDYHQWEASVRGAAMWRNKGYVGLGSLVPMQRRLTVSASSATYEDVEFSSDPGYAGSIVVGPDRVWWVDPEDSDESNLRYSLDQLVTRSNPFLVGDPGILSTGLGTYGRSALAGSEVGAFGFTDLGISVRVLESLRGQRSPVNGQWITTLWGWTYITTSVGLKATIPGQVENPAGPGADRRYEGPNGRVTAIWATKDALFAAALTPDGNTYLYRGEFDDGRYGGNTAASGRPAWFPFAYLAATTSLVIFSTGLRPSPTLLVGEGANASYWTLSAADRDISDPLYRFHTGTGRWFGTTMMRSPNLHKSPRYFTGEFEDCDATNGFQIALGVDGRSYVNIGSQVIASGHKFIYPVTGTPAVPLDTVSGHFFKPEVICTSDDDVLPPKMRGTLDMVYDERPDTIIEHEFVIEAGAAQGGTNGGEIEFSRLSALFSAHGQGADSPFEFELPGSNQKIYGLVASLGDLQDLSGDGVQRVTVVVQEWPTSQIDDDDDE